MKNVPLVEISANLSYIWRRKGPETLQKDAASPQKYLKVYNLTTTNATLIKLTMIIYLHKMFNLAEGCGI